MADLTDRELLKAAREDMRRLNAADRRITLEIDELTAWVLLGQLQLALRHPANRTASSVVAWRIVERLIAELGRTPALRELAERGLDPSHDVPTREVVP